MQVFLIYYKHMLFLSIMHHYVFWHYTQAWSALVHLWAKFLKFEIQFFSIPQLLQSWFSPWKRMTENRGETWDLEDLASFVIINLISRIIGAILRTIVIFVGLVCVLASIAIGLVALLFWALAPVVIIGLLGSGIALVFA